MVVSEGEEEQLELLRTMVASCNSAQELEDSGFRINLRFERCAGGGEEDRGCRHTLRLSFPARYPAERAQCSVEWPEGTRTQHEYINGSLSQHCESLVGEEMGYAMVNKAEELIREEVRDMEEQRMVRMATQQDDQWLMVGAATRFKRTLIFFHHIIAAGKRAAVQDWALELKLGGYSKIGWPGIVIVEGEEARVDAYVRALKRLKWQHMEVRGEEIEEVPEGSSVDLLRRLHWGFEELPESGMSVLAERCREAGLEALFKTSLK
uniref:RWD domain-containing protein n=1 Tax=Hemiselmis andersenii TaxID=464988 RepID=A0A7S1HIF5_HEMAN